MRKKSRKYLTNKVLHNVVMDKSFTCLKYALARIGLLHIYPIDYDCMIKGGRSHFKVFEIGNKEDLKKGDLIIYGKPENKILPIEISGKSIISRKVITGVHYMVYEGNGIVSDAAPDHGYYTIAMQRIDDIKKEFTHILRIDTK